MSQYRGIIVPTNSGLRIVVGHSIDEIIVFDRTLVTTLCTGLALTILLAVGCGAALNRMSNRRIRAISETSPKTADPVARTMIAVLARPRAATIGVPRMR